MGRNGSGTEGGNRSSVRDMLGAEFVPLAREVEMERRRQPASRIGRSPGTHMLVHLTGPPAAILVVPEVPVISALDLLDPEATANLHDRVMELPLHKGNCEVGESRSPSVRRLCPAHVLIAHRLRFSDDQFSPVQERGWRMASSARRTGPRASRGTHRRTPSAFTGRRSATTISR